LWLDEAGELFFNGPGRLETAGAGSKRPRQVQMGSSDHRDRVAFDCIIWEDFN
jgi:hypothetical protein